MKTTLEIPDSLFRQAKSVAAARGLSLKDFVTDALRARLAAGLTGADTRAPEWMQGFGKLKRLHKETQRVQAAIDREFDIIEPEDRG